MGLSSFQAILAALTLIMTAVACDSNNSDFRESGPVQDSKISIEILDSDYSTGLTNTYSIKDNELVVSTTTGSVNDSVHVVFRKTLSELEMTNLHKFMKSFPLEELEELYADDYIDDGDQKIFLIEKGNTKKQIQISNRYQEDIGKLVTLINGYLEDKFMIQYGEFY